MKETNKGQPGDKRLKRASPQTLDMVISVHFGWHNATAKDLHFPCTLVLKLACAE